MVQPENIDFLGCDPVITAETLARLSHDLAELAAGRYPSPDHLRHAPVLRSWSFDQRPRPCLKGMIYDHPLIGQGRNGVTSEIYAIDPGRRWVRTLSRYYELGPTTLHGI